MNPKRSSAGLLVRIGCLVLAGFAARQSRAAELTTHGPAVVDKPVAEADLTTVRLTREAEGRLGISTAAVERRRIDRTRTLGGEVIVPARAATAGATGSQSIFSLLPSLTATDLIRVAEAQIDADGQVAQAQVQLNATKVAAARAEKLLRAKAGSARATDEARVQVGLAEAVLRTAQARRDLLGATVLDVNNPRLVWVRVPVYVGDVTRLRTTQEARVGALGAPAGASTRAATPVVGPPSANPSAATIDLFYAVANDDGALRLGQKVAVIMALQEPDNALVVPWAAVVHDFHGDAWVYENLGPQLFARRRVQVRFVTGSTAALESGPPPGAKVVVSGAAELFGAELGSGH